MSDLLTSEETTESTSSTSVTLPEWLRGPMEDLVTRSTALTNEDYNAYTDPRIAGFTDDELRSFQMTRDMAGAYNDDLDFAGQATREVARRGLEGFSQEELQPYMNPYTENVLDVNRDRQINEFDRYKRDTMGRNAQIGSFGGSRVAFQEEQMYDDFARRLQEQEYRGLADRFNVGMAGATQGTQMAGQGAINIGNMAGQRQGLTMQDANALRGVGGMQRGYDQGLLDLNYEEFLREEANPYTQLQFQQAVINPAASLMRGSTSNSQTTTENTMSPVQAAVGIGSMLMGAGGGGGGMNSPLGSAAMGSMRSMGGGGSGGYQTISSFFNPSQAMGGGQYSQPIGPTRSPNKNGFYGKKDGGVVDPNNNIKGYADGGMIVGDSYPAPYDNSGRQIIGDSYFPPQIPRQHIGDMYPQEFDYARQIVGDSYPAPYDNSGRQIVGESYGSTSVPNLGDYLQKDGRAIGTGLQNHVNTSMNVAGSKLSAMGRDGLNAVMNPAFAYGRAIGQDSRNAIDALKGYTSTSANMISSKAPGIGQDIQSGLGAAGRGVQEGFGYLGDYLNKNDELFQRGLTNTTGDTRGDRLLKGLGAIPENMLRAPAVMANQLGKAGAGAASQISDFWNEKQYKDSDTVPSNKLREFNKQIQAAMKAAAAGNNATNTPAPEAPPAAGTQQTTATQQAARGSQEGRPSQQQLQQQQQPAGTKDLPKDKDGGINWPLVMFGASLLSSSNKSFAGALGDAAQGAYARKMQDEDRENAKVNSQIEAAEKQQKALLENRRVAAYEQSVNQAGRRKPGESPEQKAYNNLNKRIDNFAIQIMKSQPTMPVDIAREQAAKALVGESLQGGGGQQPQSNKFRYDTNGNLVNG